MLKTLDYTQNGRPKIVSVDAYDLIKHNLPAIGTNLMADWLKPQGACLFCTVKGLRVRVNPFNDGYTPEAA